MSVPARSAERRFPGICRHRPERGDQIRPFPESRRPLEQLDRHFCRWGPARLGGIDLTGSGINLHSGDQMDAHITYDGTTFNLTLTDLVTQAAWSHPFVINIPATVGGDTAYVGFTGGTGGQTATQQILNWSYQAGQAPYDPTGFLLRAACP